MALRYRPLRAELAVLVALATLTLVVGYADAERANDRVTGDLHVERAVRTGERAPVVTPRPAGTVAVTDSNASATGGRDEPRARTALAPRVWDVRSAYGGTSGRPTIGFERR